MIVSWNDSSFALKNYKVTKNIYPFVWIIKILLFGECTFALKINIKFMYKYFANFWEENHSVQNIESLFLEMFEDRRITSKRN